MPAKKRGPWSPQLGGQPVHGQDAPYGAQGRNEPGGPFVEAPQTQADSGEPVNQGGFFQVGQKIEMRSEVISQHQHLPGNFRVPAFIRIHEAGDAQAEKKEQAAQNQEEEAGLVEPLENRRCFHRILFNCTITH